MTQSKKMLNPKIVSGVAEVTPEELLPVLDKVKLIDVRTPDEFMGPLGHIPGSLLATLGPDLIKCLEAQDKSQEIVFVCRVGGRSREACLISQKLGFKSPINLQGGMVWWNQYQFPTEKE